jgi:hypothetical protein
MKRFLLTLIGLLTPGICAADLADWGQNNQGVSEMWSIIDGSLYTHVAGGDVVAALTYSAVNFIFPLISASGVVLIMYAGIRMIASQGKEDEFSKGKTIIFYAFIGIILSLIARVAIQFFVQGFLPEFLR